MSSSITTASRLTRCSFLGVSTAAAYLNQDVLARSNLTIAVNCHVNKVTFDDFNDGMRASGVELSVSSFTPRYLVHATREVILSAGAFCTPKILLLSGIGPSADLNKLGIPLVQDLPTGKYLSEVRRPVDNFCAR